MALRLTALEERIRRLRFVGARHIEKGRSRLRHYLKILGPGIVTGAADDDPSGIATYSQAGAQFGYSQLWTVIFMYPLMTAVQEACARIGAVTGKGIAAVIREHYSKKALYAAVWLVVLANTINIGADIGAMAEAAHLIVPLPFTMLTLVFSISILILEIFTTYAVYSRILKWLVLSLLAYPVTIFVVSEPWTEVLKSTFLPGIRLDFDFLYIITGVLGTTISPYMFFWQASEEVEEEIRRGCLTEDGKPPITWHYIHNVRVDNAAGMLASEIATWSIIVVTATVLHRGGVTDIRTAADAAKALEPLVTGFPHSGFIAQALFAAGIVGLGFLAVPVLAGSASYGLSEAFNWNEGLYRKLRQAHGFYGVITIATVAGLSINFIGINPLKALIFSAVFNGVAAVPLMYLILRISRNREIMGEYRSRWLSSSLIRITFIAMGGAAIAMLATIGR